MLWKFLADLKLFLFSGKDVAVKVLDGILEVIEEIEAEYVILRDFGNHANIPEFYGIYLHRNPKGADQLWIVMQVGSDLNNTESVCLNERILKINRLNPQTEHCQEKVITNDNSQTRN